MQVVTRPAETGERIAPYYELSPRWQLLLDENSGDEEEAYDGDYEDNYQSEPVSSTEWHDCVLHDIKPLVHLRKWDARVMPRSPTHSPVANIIVSPSANSFTHPTCLQTTQPSLLGEQLKKKTSANN